MSSSLMKELPRLEPSPQELKLVRRHSRQAGLFDRDLLQTAFRQSLLMLRPTSNGKTP